MPLTLFIPDHSRLLNLSNDDHGQYLLRSPSSNSRNAMYINYTTPTQYAFSVLLNTDSYSRFYLRANGEHGWGGGAANPDVTLFRPSASALQLGTVTAQNDLYLTKTLFFSQNSSTTSRNLINIIPEWQVSTDASRLARLRITGETSTGQQEIARFLMGPRSSDSLPIAQAGIGMTPPTDVTCAIATNNGYMYLGSQFPNKTMIDLKGYCNGDLDSTTGPAIRFYNQNGGANQISLGGAQGIHLRTLAAASVGAIFQGFASQTADIIQIKNSGGTVISALDAGGIYRSVVNSSYAPPAVLATSGLEVNLASNSLITLGDGAAGTANPALTMYRTAAGSRSGVAMRLFWSSANGGPLQFQYGSNSTYGSEAYTTVAEIGYANNFNLRVLSDSAGRVPFAIKGTTSQSGDLAQFFDVTPTLLAGVDSAGARYRVGATSAVAEKSYVSGDTVNRFQRTVDGTMSWGPGGSTALDTGLNRTAAGSLQMTGNGSTITFACTNAAFITLNRSSGNPALFLQSGGTTLTVGRINGVASTNSIAFCDNSAATTYYDFGSATLTLKDAINLVVGSTTGTKIGTATTQKIGFFNATPVVQQTVTGSKSSGAALVSLLAALAALGLIVDSTTA